MIVLFTDFGATGPYVGQMKAVLAREAPEVPVIDLLHQAPRYRPRAAAYLLAALVRDLPPDAVCLAVVDPGVGSDRAPLVIEADNRRFVGPDNGLFEMVIRRAGLVLGWEISWRPDALSASFHGRDLFAPVAARLARGDHVPAHKADMGRVRRRDWPDDLGEFVYIDDFGNAMTGIRAAGLDGHATVRVGGQVLTRARTFSDVPPGAAFWYENSSGLVEVAVNQGRADGLRGVRDGAPVTVGN